jgi:hypothetical protein
MSNAIEHFSRYRVENTTLQVMADLQRDLDRLIREEQMVIRRYVRFGHWPHKWVNMFVLEDLQPLIAQIKSAAKLSSVLADDIDRRPMVNVYDTADPSECAVFVNRGALEREGLWHDEVALRALLAHEHGHPVSENETIRRARELSVVVTTEGDAPEPAVEPILHLIADRLCVHAAQEVFANEVTIKAGFADALYHLDLGMIEKARENLGKRDLLLQGLEQQVGERKLNTDQAAAIALVGDMQMHLPFALEIAPFLRAGHRKQGAALETALIAGVVSRLDPEVRLLYEKLRDHYLLLAPAMSAAALEAWCRDALNALAATLGRRKWPVHFSLTRRRTANEAGTPPRRRQSASNRHALEHEGGAP